MFLQRREKINRQRGADRKVDVHAKFTGVEAVGKLNALCLD